MIDVKSIHIGKFPEFIMERNRKKKKYYKKI